jgi:hypothetical protein
MSLVQSARPAGGVENYEEAMRIEQLAYYSGVTFIAVLGLSQIAMFAGAYSSIEAFFAIMTVLFYASIIPAALFLISGVLWWAGKAPKRVALSIVRMVRAPFRRLWLRRSGSRRRDLRTA